MKKIFSFIIICLWVLGTVGGFGYSIHSGATLIALAVAVLGIMAFPVARDAYRYLTSQSE